MRNIMGNERRSKLDTIGSVHWMLRRSMRLVLHLLRRLVRCRTTHDRRSQCPDLVSETLIMGRIVTALKELTILQFRAWRLAVQDV
jgi:hypothetical protein